MLEWRQSQHHEKLRNVQQRKKMKDAEEEAKRDKKWKEYNAKTDDIKRKLQDKFYGANGAGGHGIG